MKHLRALALFLLLLPFTAFAGEGKLHVENPWIREAPPTANVMAAYMHLHNKGKDTVVIVGAVSERFELVEIHETVVEDGMARMVPQESLRIPADDHINLEPNGYHLMLIGPNQAIKAGGTVPLTLLFADGSNQALDVPVRKATGDESGHDHHHHHHH